MTDKGTIEELNRAAAQVTYLSEAGKVLASSIQLKTTFNHLAEVLLPELADACVISLVTKDGIERLAVRHVDKDKEKILQVLTEKFPVKLAAKTGAPFVIRTRNAELVTQFTKEYLEAFQALEVMARDLELLSYMTVPMILPEQDEVIGAIWLGTTKISGRYLTQGDLRLALDLSVLAAQAVKNSSLYETAVGEAEKVKVRQMIKDEFVSKQVHDVKTPLTAASLVLQLMGRTSKDSPAITARVQNALDNIARAVEMIDNLNSIHKKKAS